MNELLTQVEAIAPTTKTDPLDGVYRLPQGGYIRRRADGSYIEETEAQAKRYFMSLGFRGRKASTEDLSPADFKLFEVAEKRGPEYVGRLSNAPRGEQMNNGHFIIVTEESPIIPPVRGPFPKIRATLEHLLAPQELAYFLTWLKTSLEVYNARRTDSAPAVILVGIPNNGKTVTIELIVKPLFGGRSASPKGLYDEGGGFNGELAEASLLFLDDPPGRVTHRDRLTASAKLKEIVAAGTHRIERKYFQAENFEVFWRFVMTVNSGEEHLLAIPTIDPAMKDKILLLQTRGEKEGFKDGEMPFPFPARTMDERKLLQEQIANELPAFAFWLLQEYVPEPHTLGKRFAVAAFQDPDIMEKLERRTLEKRLLQLIYMPGGIPWSNPNPETKGFVTTGDNPQDFTAESLQEHLTNSNACCPSAARDLLCGKWQDACATLLGRLAAQCPDKVRRLGEDDVLGVQWRIYPRNWAERLENEKKKKAETRTQEVIAKAAAKAARNQAAPAGCAKGLKRDAMSASSAYWGGHVPADPYSEGHEVDRLMLEAGWEEELAETRAIEEALF